MFIEGDRASESCAGRLDAVEPDAEAEHADERDEQPPCRVGRASDHAEA